MTTTPAELVPVGDRERSYQGLRLAISPQEALARLQELQAFVQVAMKKGEDYGRIPGTQKDTLFQPGAQKLAEIYGLGWRIEDVETVKDWQTPFFYFEKRIVLFSRRDGFDIGQGIGSCNSREDRYAWRWCFESEVPKGMDKSSILSRTKDGKNGKPYTQFRLPNPDIFSLVNTIQKMALKRAFVGGVIACTRSSALFTQDLEDLPEEVYGAADGARSWEKGKAFDDPAAVVAEIATAATVSDLAKIAARNKDKKWADDDRDAIKRAIDARKAEIAPKKAATKEPPAKEAPPAREPGGDDEEGQPQ